MSKLTKSKNFLVNFFLGVPIGITFMLIMSSSQIRFIEAGANKTIIGLFALLHIPHLIKMFLGMVLDRFSIPISCKYINKTLLWALFIQLGLIVTILVVANTDISTNLFFTYCMLLIASFFGASQEVILDGYRIEIQNSYSHLSGIVTYVFGYRLGTILGGAGMLYLSIFFSWKAAYIIPCIFILLSLLCILYHSITCVILPSDLPSNHISKLNFSNHSIVNFFNKEGWSYILLFIFFLKFSDGLIHLMGNSFFLEMGFSKLDIANAAKFVGTLATILGGIVGGIWAQKKGIYSSFIISWTLHLFAAIILPTFLYIDYHIPSFYLSVAAEHFTNGVSNVIFVLFLTKICTKEYGRTQYAILTSIWALSVVCSSVGGWFTENLGWFMFFVCAIIFEIPTIILFIKMSKLKEYSKILSKGSVDESLSYPILLTG